MPIEFVPFEDAREADGLRMVVVTGLPSPWGEAAKGILHAKGIAWKAVALDQMNNEMAAWTGQRSGPVAIHEKERPRSGWAEILLLAERLAPAPALLPADTDGRARAFGLAHEICGEQGLGWTRRLQLVDSGLQGNEGFSGPIAQYLADKYGYRSEDAAGYTARVVDLLTMLAGILTRQKAAGSNFYLGDGLTAVDIYSAAFMAMFEPLAPEYCPMPKSARRAFTIRDEATEAALAPILLEHRDFIYREYLELPLTLA
jgi:glutathione S-transferase